MFLDEVRPVTSRPGAGTGEEGFKRIMKESAERIAQPGAEGAQDAALHHVQAPEQKRDAAHEP